MNAVHLARMASYLSPLCFEPCGPCEDCCDCGPSAEEEAQRRARLMKVAWALTLFTILWNVVEAAATLITGALARSVALIAFGLDSLAEVSSALVVTWWLARRPTDKAAHERRAVRLIALSFFGIAAYVIWEAIADLVGVSQRPDPSTLGIVVLALSVVVMPILAWAKRRVASGLDSAALRADAAETRLCFYLSAVVLAGLVANGLFGWWWMDPLAGLAVAWVAIREGREAWAGGEESEAALVVTCQVACCPSCPQFSSA